MKRLLLTLALSLWLPLAAAAQCTCSGIGTIHCSAPGDGLGPDLPRNVTVTTPLAGDPTQAQVCWDNSSPEFGVLQLTQQLYPPPSSPDVDRLIAGPNSASTHTCVTANHLYPNNFGYGFNIAVNPNGIPTWALTGPAPRNAASPPMSLMPAGNGQANTCVFFTASTSGALAFQTIPAINQQGYLFSTAYGNSAVNIPITNAVTAGPAGCSGSSCGAMRRMVVTSLTADGQACTVASAGGVCGTTHIYTQFLCDNSEALNPATNNYDAGVLTSGPYSGKYFCDNTWFGQGLEFLRYWTDASTTLGVHHLQYQLTALDGSNNVLATATSPSYAVTVLAAPSAPGTPTLTTESADVKNFDWLNGVETVDFFEQFRIANTTLPGVYLNDSASSTEYTYLPTTILSYDGDATALNLWRWYSTAPAFISGGSYQKGDKFCSAGAGANACAHAPTCVLVAGNAGTAGVSQPACPAVNATVTSNAVIFHNVGNGDYWQQQGQRTETQNVNQDSNTKSSITLGEWAIFPWGIFMDCELEHSPCNGTYPQKVLAYMSYPNAPGGLRNSGCVFDYVTTPLGTIRRMPYCIDTLLTYWMATGTYPTVNGVDVLKAFIDVWVQTGFAILDKTYYDGDSQWPFAIGMDYANFDVMGLWGDTGISIYDAQHYMTSHGWSGTPDPRIPDLLKKVGDYFYSTQWAISGNNSVAYEPGLIPNNQQLYNNNQTNLNNLSMIPYIWLWGIYGDSCTLPTSGVACKQAAKNMWNHTWDNVLTGSGKEPSQIDRSAFDYIHWIQGDYSPLTRSWFPDQNAFVGAFPDTTEPIPDVYPAQPLCTPLTHTSAACSWYTHEAVATCTVYTGFDAGLTTGAQSCTGGASTLVDASTQRSQCSFTCSGLNPPASGVLFYAVGGPDAAGNVGKEETVPGGGLFQMTMPAGGGSIQFTSGQPPNGEVNVAYSFTMTVANGTGPYTWTLNSGTLPAGITLQSGCTGLSCHLQGTPTAAGTASYQIKVCDSLSACTAQNQSLTIVPGPTVTTTALPNGQVGSAYSATLTARDGILPYAWTQLSGTLPPGVTLAVTGVLSGTPTAAGAYTAQYQVCDVNHQCAPSPNLTITISSAGLLAITTTRLPSGTVNVPYNAPIATVNGTLPLTWTISAGAENIPAGLALQPGCTGATCAITGVPTQPSGSSPTPSIFVVKVTDAASETATQSFYILIQSPQQNSVTLQGNVTATGNVTITAH